MQTKPPATSPTNSTLRNSQSHRPPSQCPSPRKPEYLPTTPPHNNIFAARSRQLYPHVLGPRKRASTEHTRPCHLRMASLATADQSSKADTPTVGVIANAPDTSREPNFLSANVACRISCALLALGDGRQSYYRHTVRSIPVFEWICVRGGGLLVPLIDIFDILHTFLGRLISSLGLPGL